MEGILEQVVRVFTERIGSTFYIIMALFPVALLYIKTRTVMVPLFLLMFEGFLLGYMLPSPVHVVGYILGALGIGGLLVRIFLR